jgi:hypothetical protein
MAGLGAGAIAWTAVPLAIGWVANAWWLGRRQEALAPAQPGGRYPVGREAIAN